MNTPRVFQEKIKGSAVFQRLEVEYAKIESGDGDISLYLDTLDCLLIQLLITDMLEENVSEALNGEYLKFMYPQGENGPKRNTKNCTLDEIRKAGLDVGTIKAFVGKNAIQSSGMIADLIKRTAKNQNSIQ